MEQKKRKVKEGIIVSSKMQKTVAVKVERTISHPRYNKVVVRAKKYYAHAGDQQLNEGQRVKIEETRPLSKMKRWIVVDVLS